MCLLCEEISPLSHSLERDFIFLGCEALGSGFSEQRRDADDDHHFGAK
jgi:hypothetical protein